MEYIYDILIGFICSSLKIIDYLIREIDHIRIEHIQINTAFYSFHYHSYRNIEWNSLNNLTLRFLLSTSIFKMVSETHLINTYFYHVFVLILFSHLTENECPIVHARIYNAKWISYGRMSLFGWNIHIILKRL